MMMLLGLAAGLLYPPPAMDDPVTVVLGTGRTVSRLNPSRDYILKCPHALKIGATIVLGGRNVIIRGCEIAIPNVTPAGDANRRAVYVKGASGTVHIEGVSIVNPYGGQFDAFYFAAPAARVVLQNIRVEGLTGRHGEFHSDAVQTEGMRELRIRRMTVVGGYQMFHFFSPKGKPDTGEVWMEDVNGRYVGHQIFGRDDVVRGDNGGTFVWLVKGLSCAPAAGRVHLNNVFVRLYPERRPGQVGQPDDRKPGCAALVAYNGRSVTWPSLPVDGQVTLGEPPRGDFVPAGSVGHDYHR